MGKLSLPYDQEFDSILFRFINGENIGIIVMLGEEKPLGFFFGDFNSFLSTLPKYVKECKVIKILNKKQKVRFDFSYKDSDGYTIRIEGLSRGFDNQYTNYAKLVSGYFRTPISTEEICKLIKSLNGMSELWINTVINALTQAQEEINKRKNKN